MQDANAIDPLSLVRPRRAILGMSAVYLPFSDESGSIDFNGFRNLLERTHQAGLVPAVNMDTGSVHLLDDPTKKKILDLTRSTLGGAPFIAGAFVRDRPGDPLDLDRYRAEIETIVDHGGTPIVFQSYGLVERSSDEIIEAYQTIGDFCDRFFAFELGPQFAPFGRIYDLETYAALLDIPACQGAKHSSLDRSLEWRRIALRDSRRPAFHVLTGNDLAIDMVMYGSDYLLGLSTFAPEAFAVRDRYWKEGDAAFYEINDVLQYLGAFAFRPPVPAYRHSAAMFLKLTHRLDADHAHPKALRRPDSDREILASIAARLAEIMGIDR